jgi:protein-tyrosine phosphatase
MLRREGPALARLATHLAYAPGPVLVHCSAGKDRTGVAVAVILSVLGARSEDVLDDFAASGLNMSGVIRRLRVGASADIDALVRHRPGVFEAPVPAMRLMLDALARAPQGARGWLVAQGLVEADLRRLDQRLVVS